MKAREPAQYSISSSVESLVSQAREVAERGGKEIVLTGVNIGDFGQTTGETFLELVKALDKVEGIERYRISSIEPNLLTDELIEYCAICTIVVTSVLHLKEIARSVSTRA